MLYTPDLPPSGPTDLVPIDDLLTGGNPRTLHHVDKVVESVLSHPERLGELIACVFDGDDEIVRMRAGDALEKVCRAQPSLLQPHMPLLLGDMATIHQPSVQWHVAQMLGHVRLTAAQRLRAAELMDQDLEQSSDWIVLNCALDTLAVLAKADRAIVDDLRRQLRRHEHSRYKSLARRAAKLRSEFGPDPRPPTSTHEEGRT